MRGTRSWCQRLRVRGRPRCTFASPLQTFGVANNITWHVQKLQALPSSQTVPTAADAHSTVTPDTAAECKEPGLANTSANGSDAALTWTSDAIAAVRSADSYDGLTGSANNGLSPRSSTASLAVYDRAGDPTAGHLSRLTSAASMAQKHAQCVEPYRQEAQTFVARALAIAQNPHALAAIAATVMPGMRLLTRLGSDVLSCMDQAMQICNERAPPFARCAQAARSKSCAR